MDFAAVASPNENGANKTLPMFLIMSLIHNWSSIINESNKYFSTCCFSFSE
jgi:hypothetical protein